MYEIKRFFLRMIPICTMIFLTSVVSGAQRNSHESASDLLESGKAEKLQNPPATNEFKIVSYNIRWRSGEELKQIVSWLKAGKDSPAAAIIGLQEVDRARKRTGNANHAKALAESLGMYYAWAAPDLPKKGNTKEEETGVEILSFYPLTEITRIVLKTAGPGDRSRVAIGANLKIQDRTIRVYSVHAETRLTISQKIDQLRAILDDLARFPKTMPAIVLGDFNSWELPTIEGVRKLFTNAGFITPLPDDESTFLRKALFFDMKLKLDWIWLRGLKPQSYGIDRSLKFSDHFPIWTIARLGD